MCSFIGIFTTSKVNLRGPAPVFAQTSERGVILFCKNSQKFFGREMVVRVNNIPMYKMIPISREYLVGEKRLNKDEVLYCGTDSPLYEEALSSTACAIFACRDGIFDYTAEIERVIGNMRNYTIISLDNNPELIKKAASCSKYANFKYIHGVIDAVATEININAEGYVDIKADDNIIITLPPSASKEVLGLKNRKIPFAWEKQKHIIRIARNKLQFYWTEKNKLISVNSAHTFQIMVAAHKGISNGESIEEIHEKTFAEYFSLDEGISVAVHLHLLLYAYFFATLPKTYKEYTIKKIMSEYSICTQRMVGFLEYTYNSRDKINRGINISNPSDVQDKYYRHILYLREAVQYFEKDKNIYAAMELMKNTGKSISYNDFLEAKKSAEIVINTFLDHYVKYVSKEQ